MAHRIEAASGELDFGVPAPGLSSEREAAFHRASAHSRRVRRLKLLVPAAAVAIVLAFVAYSWVSTPRNVSVEVQGAAFSEGRLVMANPRLEGLTRDGRPYEMTAERAIQNVDRETVIDLEGIEARMPVAEDDWASVVARTGVYDRTANTLLLDSEVVVTTTEGTTARLASAFVDIGANTLQSTEPVDIERQGSRITANAMQMLEGGKRMIFESSVRMYVDPGPENPDKQTSGGTDASN